MIHLNRLLALIGGFAGYYIVFFIVGSVITRNGGNQWDAVLLLIGFPLAFVPLILVERPGALRRKAEEKTRAAQAAAEQAAATTKKEEVEDILGRYKYSVHTQERIYRFAVATDLP